jgi:hypothetical protein
MEINERVLAAKFEELLPHLGEAAADAGREGALAGAWGIELVAQASGCRARRCRQGGFAGGPARAAGRAGVPGGRGRKRLTESDPRRSQHK